MKALPKKHRMLAFVLGLALAPLLAMAVQAETVTSLRGAVGIDEDNPKPEIHQLQDSKRFTKNFRQQPPLIPHKVDKYEIDLKTNQCMRCHDWPGNAEANAPKISETHYVDRNGVALDKLARTRWFCTQCHVPQVDAPALVGNTYQAPKLKH